MATWLSVIAIRPCEAMALSRIDIPLARAPARELPFLTSASPGNPDTFLTLLGPNGVVLITDDDSGGDTNSRIPGGNRGLTLGLPGTYTIEVTPFDTRAVPGHIL